MASSSTIADADESTQTTAIAKTLPAPQIADIEKAEVLKPVVDLPPQPQPEMRLTSPTAEERRSSESSSSSESGDDNQSGYAGDQNECTEFCADFVTCFGMFEACCPSSGEGCLTTCATICGNVLLSCCRC